MVWRDSRFVRIESETNTTSRMRVPLRTKLSDYMWKPYLYLESKYCMREISYSLVGKEVNLTVIKTDVKDIGNKFNLVKDLPLVFYIPTNQKIGKGGVVPLQLWCSMKFDRYFSLTFSFSRLRIQQRLRDLGSRSRRETRLLFETF